MWRRWLRRDMQICDQRRDYTEIDCAHIASARAKVAPRRQCDPKAAQVKRASEIVSTATRHGQNRKLQLDQLRQVTVDGAVPAKDENRVGFARVSKWADQPTHLRVFLERLQVFLR